MPVELIKKIYEPGIRVRLLERMNDAYSDNGKDLEGTVKYVDDMGTIHVSWDNGSGLGLIVGVDNFTIINE